MLLVIAVIRYGLVIEARIVAGLSFRRSGLHQLVDRSGVQPGDFFEASTHQLAQIGARHFFDQRRGQCHHVRLAFQGARIGLLGQLLEKIVSQRLCVLVDSRLERVSAFGAHQGVGILPFGQEQKPGAPAVLQTGNRRFQCAPGSISASLVTVEAEQHVRHHTK